MIIDLSKEFGCYYDTCVEQLGGVIRRVAVDHVFVLGSRPDSQGGPWAYIHSDASVEEFEYVIFLFWPRVMDSYTEILLHEYLHIGSGRHTFRVHPPKEEQLFIYTSRYLLFFVDALRNWRVNILRGDVKGGLRCIGRGLTTDDYDRDKFVLSYSKVRLVQLPSIIDDG